MFLRCKLSQLFLGVAVAIAVAGCALPVTVPWPALRDDLDVASLRLAIGHGMSYLKKLPPERIVGEQPRPFTARELLDSLIAFDRLLDQWHCRDCLARAIAAAFEIIPSSAAAA